jgi:hypothetical protein
VGMRACFIVDGCTYLLSIIPWIVIKQKSQKLEQSSSPAAVNYFIGFQVLYNNVHVRALTISRMLNNLAYVTCTTTAF